MFDGLDETAIHVLASSSNSCSEGQLRSYRTNRGFDAYFLSGVWMLGFWIAQKGDKEGGWLLQQKDNHQPKINSPNKSKRKTHQKTILPQFTRRIKKNTKTDPGTR